MTTEKKYNIEIDTHCHSIASHHAMCTISEIISLARQKGLKGVTVSDHHSSISSINDKYQIKAPDIAYFTVFCRRYLNTDKNIRLFKGIELNLLDSEPWISPLNFGHSHLLDIKLAGIHTLERLFKKSENIVNNTDAVLKAIYSGEKRMFHIFAHPYTSGVPLDISSIIKACKERRIALELNNSFVLYEKVLTDNIKDMLEKAAEQGCSVSVGSDAHVPHEIGFFDESIKLLEETGFPAELIINRNMESLDMFLDDGL